MSIKSFSKERLGPVHRPEGFRRLSPNALMAQWRRYHCPYSGQRDMVGFTYEARANVVIRDRFFQRWLDPPLFFQNQDRMVDSNFAGTFDFFVSAESGFCLENTDFFVQGKVQFPAPIAKYYVAHCGPNATADITTRDLFFRALEGLQDILLSVDWFEIAQRNDLLSVDGWTRYSKRPELFTKLLSAHIKTHSMGADHRLFLQTEKEIADSVQAGLVGLIVAHCLESTAAMSLLSAAKIFELTHRLVTVSNLPAEWFNQGRHPLRCALNVLFRLRDNPEASATLDRTTASALMAELLRLGTLPAPERFARRRMAWVGAFLATEALLDAPPHESALGQASPTQLAANNEVPWYLNLLLRGMLGIPDSRCRYTARHMRDHLRERLSDRLYARAAAARSRYDEALATAVIRSSREFLSILP